MKYGKRSAANIATVHSILQVFAYRVLDHLPIDSGVDITVLDSGGLRTATDQNALFKEGRSKLDGYSKKSYHQSGLAIDLVPYLDGRATWSNAESFLTIASTALDVWESMKAEGLTEGYFLHWGGFWGAKDLNDNGLLDIDDKLGWDLPHWELRKVEQVKGVMPVW
jgi:peptidoglycan L-alanyl-D-glutamate endopeptidase CwlK|tara:strand:+ start:60 stop:557 length:498 start_codon:yes stop_codon:yes gene_type:complete